MSHRTSQKTSSWGVLLGQASHFFAAWAPQSPCRRRAGGGGACGLVCMCPPWPKQKVMVKLSTGQSLGFWRRGKCGWQGKALSELRPPSGNLGAWKEREIERNPLVLLMFLSLGKPLKQCCISFDLMLLSSSLFAKVLSWVNQASNRRVFSSQEESVDVNLDALLRVSAGGKRDYILPAACLDETLASMKIGWKMKKCLQKTI